MADVELAALEAGPFAAALLGESVSLVSTPFRRPCAISLLVDPDDDDAEVGQRLRDVLDPLERDRLGDDDDGAAGAARLPGQRERGKNGERLAHADVEAEATAPVGVEPTRARDLVRVQDDRGIPPRELERRGTIAVAR